MYELATHPEVQKKVAQELDEIMGDKEYPDYEDLEKMNYLYCVIKETLRLHPPVPEIGRVLSEPVDILGHHLPAGVSLLEMQIPFCRVTTQL
jgi:cytochrome P450